MLLLVPASVVTVAAIVRAGLALRRGELEPGDAQRHTVAPVQRIAFRLEQIRERTGALTAEDVRAEVMLEAVRLYAMLQPLVAVFVLSPLVGLLGSITGVMAANLDLAGGGSPEALAAAVERALVPGFWGVLISGVAYAGYVLLRARLYHCERTFLMPGAEEAAVRLTKPLLARHFPEADRQSERP